MASDALTPQPREGLPDQIIRQFETLTQRCKGLDDVLVRVVASLGRGLGQTDEQVRKGLEHSRQQAHEHSYLTDRVRTASSAIFDFSQALLPIPTTLSGLVKSSLAAAGPGPLSTLEKSFQLVLLGLAQGFVPALVLAIRALQELAVHAKETGKGMQNAWHYFFGGDRARMKGELEASKQAAPHHEEAMRLHKAEMEIRRRMEAGEKTIDGFDPEKLLEAIKAKRARLTQAFRDALGAGGGADAAGAGGAGGAGGAAGGGTSIAHDVKPPGYHASFMAIEDVRRQMQVSALNMTSLDIKIMQEQTELLKALLAEMQRQGKSGPVLPPR